MPGFSEWIKNFFRNDCLDLGAFARSNKVAEASSILDKGVDINCRDTNGMTPLIAAAGKGYLDMVKLLIERGADVSLKEKRKGLSALKFAAGGGHSEVIRLLLDAGADVNELDYWGRGALIFAAGKGVIENVKMLIERGAEVNVKDVYGNTALTVAEDMGHIEVQKILLDAGATPIERFHLQ